MTTEKPLSPKSSSKKSSKKRSSQKKSTKDQFEGEIQKIPDKMRDIIVDGILRDLLIIVCVPLIYNVFRTNWSQIIALPILADSLLNQMGNIIVLGINLYEAYFDLYEKRSLPTAVVDFIVNVILGIVFADSVFIVMGIAYLVIMGLRYWLKHQKNVSNVIKDK